MTATPRHHYRIFAPGRIGRPELPNRLVRSATWDPAILLARALTDPVLALYRRLAAGGVGLIITGDFSILPAGLFDTPPAHNAPASYEQVRIRGLNRLAGEVHRIAPSCKIVAQISADCPGAAPSDLSSPFTHDRPRPLTGDQVRTIVDRFSVAIAGLQADGFDGVQLHAAHGGLLSSFLSPYTNRRRDAYGGSAANRARIIAEIVAAARSRVGDFPILIKMNSTDYLDGGIDATNLPELAREVANAGVDAIEISGGMWECLVRTEQELGFRPVPAPESHTRIRRPDRQSYFRGYAALVDVPVPLILVGGNRDIDRLEAILAEGIADFISLCRPLIREPDLPARWLEGRGDSHAACISCNSCLYDMWTHVDRAEPWVATCLVQHDLARVKDAQRWLNTWVRNNVAASWDSYPPPAGQVDAK
jgi:2,4-dienoyl-CoA reductase-like NADH-dependent reductase (Old Yellow Enzyme family)